MCTANSCIANQCIVIPSTLPPWTPFPAAAHVLGTPRSLLRPLPPERSCADAGLSEAYCSCSRGDEAIVVAQPVAAAAAHAVLNVTSIATGLCRAHNLHLDKVLLAARLPHPSLQSCLGEDEQESASANSTGNGSACGDVIQVSFTVEEGSMVDTHTGQHFEQLGYSAIVEFVEGGRSEVSYIRPLHNYARYRKCHQQNGSYPAKVQRKRNLDALDSLPKSDPHQTAAHVTSGGFCFC